MPITLTERIDKLNDLIEKVKSKQERLKVVTEKMETLQQAIDYLEKTVEGKEISASIECEYQDSDEYWRYDDIPVSRESFIEFLKEQKEEYCAAAEKLADELGETMRDKRG